MKLTLGLPVEVWVSVEHEKSYAGVVVKLDPSGHPNRALIRYLNAGQNSDVVDRNHWTNHSEVPKDGYFCAADHLKQGEKAPKKVSKPPKKGVKKDEKDSSSSDISK